MIRTVVGEYCLSALEFGVQCRQMFFVKTEIMIHCRKTTGYERDSMKNSLYSIPFQGNIPQDNSHYGLRPPTKCPNKEQSFF